MKLKLILLSALFSVLGAANIWAQDWTGNEDLYLRNRETGRFMSNGGWWGSHAVVSNYGKVMHLKSLGNNKYELTSSYGHFTDAAYLDNNNESEYIKEFTLIEKDGYKILSYEINGTTKAFTANDPTYFNDNPLYRYVTTAPINEEDRFQQWEILTEEQLMEEMSKASLDHPFNATHLIKSANFDRIDWGAPGWTFDNKNNGDRVSETIGGPDNDAFCNFNRSVNTKQSGTYIKNSNNQWDCYQELSVPAGYYRVSCQGFEKGTQCTYLYAWSNPEGKHEEKKVLLSRYNSADFTDGDNQNNAARAFNDNKYNNTINEIIKVGTDGKLVVGVKKTDNNSTSGWMVFDNFQLEYLGNTTATMTVNATAQYGTFCSPFAVEVPSGVEASTATLDGTKIVLSEPLATIPANTPVILYAENGLAATTLYGAAVSGTPTAGSLTGVYTATTAQDGWYVLQNNDNKVGFYKVDTEKATPTIGANRCYLTTGSSNARAFYLGEEEETAVATIEALTTGTSEIYDINGIRTNRLQKGINIVKLTNGKTQKVIVK